MILSSHPTGVDELQGLAVAQGAVLDSLLSDADRLISLDHLTAEQLEISTVLVIIILSALGQTQARGFVDITNSGNTHVVVVNTIGAGRTSVSFGVSLHLVGTKKPLF